MIGRFVALQRRYRALAPSRARAAGALV